MLLSSCRSVGQGLRAAGRRRASALRSPASRVRERERCSRDARRRAPTIWAAMNAGTEAGAMPAKVSENIRPMVIAGLAKLVEEVNQYAAPM